MQKVKLKWLLCAFINKLKKYYFYGMSINLNREQHKCKNGGQKVKILKKVMKNLIHGSMLPINLSEKNKNQA